MKKDYGPDGFPGCLAILPDVLRALITDTGLDDPDDGICLEAMLDAGVQGMIFTGEYEALSTEELVAALEQVGAMRHELNVRAHRIRIVLETRKNGG